MSRSLKLRQEFILRIPTVDGKKRALNIAAQSYYRRLGDWAFGSAKSQSAA